MHYTGLSYQSTEKTPKVLPEYAELLPPLGEQQFLSLQEDILQNGCYSPILVDENLTVVDGHHRLKICLEHNIPFELRVFHFEDSLEAKQWMLDTQRARRNLTDWELGQIALKLRPDVEARAKNNLSAGGKHFMPSEEPSANLPKVPPIDTREELAKAVGIGSRNMGKIMQIDAHGPEAVKEALDNHELSIHQGYNITKQVKSLPAEQREDEAKALIRAQYDKATTVIDQETEAKTKIAKQFSKVFEQAVMLDPTEENILVWVQWTRMTEEEQQDKVREANRLAEKFATIAQLIANLSTRRNDYDDTH